MNIEQTIIEYLKGMLSVPVSSDVPKKRPGKFVTIERVGGPLSSVVLDNPSIAIQSWAGSRVEASELADEVDKAMRKITDIPNITQVSRNTIYNFPPPDYPMARYQGLYDLIFYKEE